MSGDGAARERGARPAHLSLAARLLITRFVLALVGLAGFGGYAWMTLKNYVVLQEDEELTSHAQLVHHRLEGLVHEIELAEVLHQIDDALIGSTRLHVVVESAHGRLLYATSGVRAPASIREQATQLGGPGPALGEWFEGHKRYRAAAGWVESRGLGGWLAYSIVLDTSTEERLMRRVGLALVIGLAIVLLASLALSWALDRVALRPLRAVARVASRVSPSRLGERFDLERIPPDLRAYAGAFNDMLDRLQDGYRRLSEFSSDIAHELRTPINALMIQTQVMLSSERECADYQRTLESNLEELGRLSRMISDMLFLARADARQQALTPAEVDLGAEVERIASLFEPAAEEKGIRLEAGGGARVQADLTMVQRAINNLLSNALRHTPAGGLVRVRVEEAGERIGAVASVRVENTGDPIPPEVNERLFDRFYRAESSREFCGEGAGLGLALVRSIMELHGGSVSVEREGDRNVFTLHFLPNLPLARPVRAAPPVPGTLAG